MALVVRIYFVCEIYFLSSFWSETYTHVHAHQHDPKYKHTNTQPNRNEHMNGRGQTVTQTIAACILSIHLPTHSAIDSWYVCAFVCVPSAQTHWHIPNSDCYYVTFDSSLSIYMHRIASHRKAHMLHSFIVNVVNTRHEANLAFIHFMAFVCRFFSRYMVSCVEVSFFVRFSFHFDCLLMEKTMKSKRL